MIQLLANVGYGNWVLDALLVVPLIGALAVLSRPAHEAKRVALVSAVVEFLISVPLWWTFEIGTAAMQFQHAYPWIPAWGIYYMVGLDGLSLFMVLLTTFTMPLAVLGSWNYIKDKLRPYYALLLVLTTGMIGVFVALDLFMFYVFWEIMLIPMYFIIGVWGGPRRLYAAIKFFIYTFVGSLLMLVAILTMYYMVGRTTGIYSFAYQHILDNITAVGRWGFWLFGAFALAFAIKVPMFPFHTWLPDAHVEAPTAGSVILAGILLKMGTYGFLRFALPFFPTVALHPTVVTIVVGLAIVGIVYGALRQPLGLRDAGYLGPHDTERRGRDHHHDQSWYLDGSSVLSGRNAQRAAAHTRDRGVWWDRKSGTRIRGSSDGRVSVLNRPARNQRVHWRVSRPRRLLWPLSVGDGHRGNGSDLCSRISAMGPTANHLQQVRQAREREAARSIEAGAACTGTAAGVHSLDWPLSQAVPGQNRGFG
jgi:hypothetical protein